MASIFDQMINHDTGSIDPMIVAEAAEVRAAAEWRGPDYPPKYLRESMQWCEDRAAAMRRNWHRDRGLPVPGEETVSLVTITPYGRPRQGLRFSEYGE